MKRNTVAKKMGTSRYRYKISLGESKSGPCKQCKSMAGSHNFANSGKGGVFPPYHPNCKCGMS